MKGPKNGRLEGPDGQGDGQLCPPTPAIEQLHEVALGLLGGAHLAGVVLEVGARPARGEEVTYLIHDLDGVGVRLVLESLVESKGKLSRDAKKAFDALTGAVSFYVWPGRAPRRPVVSPPRS